MAQPASIPGQLDRAPVGPGSDFVDDLGHDRTPVPGGASDPVVGSGGTGVVVEASNPHSGPLGRLDHGLGAVLLQGQDVDSGVGHGTDRGYLLGGIAPVAGEHHRGLHVRVDRPGAKMEGVDVQQAGRNGEGGDEAQLVAGGGHSPLPVRRRIRAARCWRRRTRSSRRPARSPRWRNMTEGCFSMMALVGSEWPKLVGMTMARAVARSSARPRPGLPRSRGCSRRGGILHVGHYLLDVVGARRRRPGSSPDPAGNRRR